MPSLADVAPAFKRKIKSKTLTFESDGETYSLTINGVTAIQFAEIGARFPGFLEFAQQAEAKKALVEGDEDAENTVNIQLGMEFFGKFKNAIPVIIATGCGYHGNETEEAIAASWDEEAQLMLFNEIMTLSNRTGEGDRKAITPLGENLPNGSASVPAPAP